MNIVADYELTIFKDSYLEKKIEKIQEIIS